MNNALTITNATKANIITFVNAIMGVLIAFDVVLTEKQMGAIDIAVNAALSLWIGYTYQLSAKRTDVLPVGANVAVANTTSTNPVPPSITQG